MEQLTTQTFKEKIISYFEQNSGFTIEKAIQQIKQNLIIDKYGNTHNDSIKTNNVRLFYTNNENYSGGKKNGFGKGWYISNSGLTGGSTVKIKETL